MQRKCLYYGTYVTLPLSIPKKMKTKSLIPLLTLSLFFSTTRAIYSISSSTHANTCPDQATNYFNIMNGMPQELYFSCHVTGDLHDVVVDDVDCLSWRVAVETNNVKDWEVIPATCIGYVASYMTKQQYDVDIKVVTKVAYDYAKSLKLQGDGKDIWVFDVGQTSISFLDYYSRPDVQFGYVHSCVCVCVYICTYICNY